MNYELAKKLKDAGYSQDGEGETLEDMYVCEHHQKTHGYESCCDCDGERLCSEHKDGVYDYAYAPTLSELIEACGESFYSLCRKKNGGNNKWVAVDSFENVAYREWGSGIKHFETAEEAVANLWLALNKK